MRLLIVLVTAFTAICAEYTSYDGFKLYNVYPVSEKQVELLRLFKDNEQFDFWTGLRNGKTDIMVAPAAQVGFERFLKENNFKYDIKHKNVESVLNQAKAQHFIQKSSRVTFDRYQTNDEINNYLQELAKKYPNLVTLESMGTSFEHRDMVVLKISSGGNGTRPIIFIDGTIHAREWIAPSTVLYIIDQLLNNPSNSDLYKNVDWHILPVLNPDGYVFTHNAARLWRKTRSLGLKCIGVDANRNFDYFWGSIGASDDECSNEYKGPTPFSEIEAINLAHYTRKYLKNIKMYLSFHSYGQLLLYPWGYTNSSCENGDEHQRLGEAFRDAVYAKNQTLYKVGYTYDAIYPNSGNTIDWMKGVLNIPLTYIIELPDHGHEFDLPPSHIYGVVTETFDGIKIFAKYVDGKYGISNSN